MRKSDPASENFRNSVFGLQVWKMLIQHLCSAKLTKIFETGGINLLAGGPASVYIPRYEQQHVLWKLKIVPEQAFFPQQKHCGIQQLEE